MTYVVDTGAATLRHNQNHPGSVPIPARGMPARPTPENSFPEPEGLLGSRETPRTRHARVHGPHQHHPPAGPSAPLDQLPLHRRDRGIGGLARHGGFRQELRCEILHRDQPMRVHDGLGPHPAVVPVLPGRLLLHPRRLPAGPLITLRRRVSLPAATAGHPALGSRQLRRAPPPVPVMWQIEPFVGGRRGAGHAPVDPDAAILVCDGDRLRRPGHHERDVPVPQGIAGDAHTRRLRRQSPRPHHRNTHAFGQHQATIADPETAAGVFERWQGLLAGFVSGAAPAFDHERRVQRLRVGAQHLLLGDLGTIPQPRRPCPGLGQLLAEFRERRFHAGLLLVHCFVPQEPAAMPLLDQGVFGERARPQPVVVAHHIDPHAQHANRPHRQGSQACIITSLKGGRRFLSPVNGGVPAPNIR